MTKRSLTVTAEQLAVHGEVIRQYLEGADVEFRDSVFDGWLWAKAPSFFCNLQYRKKPLKVKRWRWIVRCYDSQGAITDPDVNPNKDFFISSGFYTEDEANGSLFENCKVIEKILASETEFDA